MDFNDVLTYTNLGKIRKLEEQIKLLDELTARVDSLERELAAAKEEIEELKSKIN